MKVLHLINQLTVGGAEKLILETIPLYNKKGITTDVVVHKSDKDHLFLSQLKEKKCCKIFELSYNSVYDPRVIFRLRKFLKSYDVIHAHVFPGFYFLAISKILFKCKAKLVYTEHSTNNRRLHLSIFKYIDQYIYSKFDKIVCITDEVKKVLTTHIKIDDNRIETIHNGINLEVIKKTKQKIPLVKSLIDKTIICQISAFRIEKDHTTLIKSLQHLSENVILILAGDGSTKPSMELLSENLNLSERVFFLGNRSDTPQIMFSSDILVLSSLYEGLSLSSIEAMASGKPFVASRVPGLKELVNDHGVLFEFGNEKDLAKKIISLTNNKSYYNEIVKKCQAKAAQYDISIMINKHIELYNAL